jgi:tyrosyl-tRNA synthetase
MKVDHKTIIDRGTKEVIKKSSLEKRLNSGRILRIKYGIDPTSDRIHLGHLIGVRKLAQFQKLGHQIVFLIGDFTTKIGDPTDRSKTRPMLTDKQIKKNMKTYLDQVGSIIDVDKTEVRYNSEWFSKMSFTDVIKLASKMSLSRIIDRKDFQKRISKGLDVRYHEGFYPLMQAYDSVALEADVEVAGYDQRLNLMAARNLQKHYNQKPEDLVMVPLLSGTDGNKMSKSRKNDISTIDAPEDIYGKVMSIPDELIVEYYHLATNLDDFEVREIEDQLELGKNPKEVKKRLAYQITLELHSQPAAEDAQSEFERVFEKGKKPTEMPEVELKSGSEFGIVNLLDRLAMVSSKSEAKRLVNQGGVRVDNAKITDEKAIVSVRDGMVVNVGKRKFKKIIAK